MTTQQINTWLGDERFRAQEGAMELVETHISWVLIGERYVYKIKKPVHYSFVNFSTLELRKFYCERELVLNSRLCTNIYLDVLPIRSINGSFSLYQQNGDIVEYAVKMRKIDRGRQMDYLLKHGEVTPADIKSLATKIARFHHQAAVAADRNLTNLRFDFNDLAPERHFLASQLGGDAGNLIARAVEASDRYLGQHLSVPAERLHAGYFRDCHGDLHCGNIFLLETPQPFDCLEFNDALRQIDVLNEVAFLCMDLESYERKDLADLFLTNYVSLFPMIRNAADQNLYLYYKGYRANIRAKVNSLRARAASSESIRRTALAEASKYLRMMDGYLQALSH